MGSVATILPLSASSTTIMLLWQPANSLRCARSMASPDGASHGAIGQRCNSFKVAVSSVTASLLSSRLTYTCPSPSDTANSGLPPRSMVPATWPLAASMAVDVCPRPFIVKTRCDAGSYTMASGPSPVVVWPMTASVFVSKMVTVRSEEHTSELQSPYDLVCRLLLEKKKQNQYASLKSHL